MTLSKRWETALLVLLIIVTFVALTMKDGNDFNPYPTSMETLPGAAPGVRVRFERRAMVGLSPEGTVMSWACILTFTSPQPIKGETEHELAAPDAWCAGGGVESSLTATVTRAEKGR